MSDIQPTEADRAKARNSLAKIIVARLLGSLEANATYIASVETLLCAFEADTVKAERDRLHRKMNDYLLDHPVIGLIDVAIILSDDHEARHG